MDELTGKALGKSAELAGKVVKPFLGRVAGPALDELGQHFADKVRFHRYGNHLKMVAKAQKMAEEAGFTPRAIPLKTLFPLLEFGSLEDDDDMQARWAALLANAANPDEEITVHPTFPGILKELGPAEARLLDALVNAFGDRHQRFYMENYGIAEDQIGPVYCELGLSTLPWVRTTGEYAKYGEEAAEKQKREFRTALDILVQHHLLDTISTIERLQLNHIDETFGTPHHNAVEYGKKYFVTTLGYEFVTACRRPKRKGGIEGS